MRLEVKLQSMADRSPDGPKVVQNKKIGDHACERTRAAGVVNGLRGCLIAAQVFVTCALLFGADTGFAQEAAQGVSDDAAAAAQRAEEAAQSADSFAEALAAELAEEAGPEDRPSPEPARAGPVTREELEEAVRAAEQAADEAWAAARAADQLARSAEKKKEQRGPYFGGGFAYAAENFEDSIIVKSGFAGSAFVGYRVAPQFAVEVRYEGFDGFDLKASNGSGEIDGYAITLNAKAYPFKGPIQPFVGIGIGGMYLENKSVRNDGTRFNADDSDVVFRILGGLDFPVTEHLILNLEAAYLVPGDELQDLEIGVIGGGITYLF